MLVCLRCGNYNRIKIEYVPERFRVNENAKYKCKVCQNNYVSDVDIMQADTLILLEAKGFNLFRWKISKFFDQENIKSEITTNSMMFRILDEKNKPYGRSEEEYVKLFNTIPEKIGRYKIEYECFADDNIYVTKGVIMKFIYDSDLPIINNLDFASILLELSKGFDDHLVEYFNNEKNEKGEVC